MARALGVAAGLAALLAACREGPEPFLPDDRPQVGTDEAWPITFGRSDEQAPLWSPDGDSVYYTGEGRRTDPRTSWLLAAVPAEGGIAEPVVVNFEAVSGAAVAVRPQRDRIVYGSVRMFTSESLCPADSIECTIPASARPLPRFIGLTLYARDLKAPAGADLIEKLRVPIAAITNPDPARPRHFEVEYHPFQAYVDNHRSFFFRPSWSPDGRRVAFSDGLAIWIWTPGAGEPVRVAGTEDGVYPAWSPDGSRIAFTRLLRGRRYDSFCAFKQGAGATAVTVCTASHTAYRASGHVLMTIRPDGSDRRDLGEGLAPAWTSDGSTLFARRDDRIWRIAADGGAAEPVPGTEGGFEPAVSPDGRRLAISRLNSHGDYDLWIVSLQR